MKITRDVFVKRETIKEPISYVQGTNTIPLEFIFRDYDIPSGSTARVYVQKPSGKAVYNAAAISGNIVTVNVTTQMFIEVGLNKLQVRVDKGSDTLVMFEQPVNVRKNYTDGNASKSENETDFFVEISKEMKEEAKKAEEAREGAEEAAKKAETATKNAQDAAQAVFDQQYILTSEHSFVGHAEISPTAEGSAIIKEIKGATKQVTTQGLNLMPDKNVSANNGVVTVFNDGKEFSIKPIKNGSICYVTFSLCKNIEELKGKTLCFSNYAVDKNNSAIKPTVALFGADDNYNPIGSYAYVVSSNEKVTLPSEFDSSNKQIVILLYLNATDKNITTDMEITYKNLWISLDEPIEWEPYTGGKPSPSIEYPQEVRGVGAIEHVIQPSEQYKGTFEFIIGNTNVFTPNVKFRASQLFRCKKGDVITYKIEKTQSQFRSIVTDKNLRILNYLNIDSLEKKQSVNMDDSYYFMFYYGSNNVGDLHEQPIKIIINNDCAILATTEKEDRTKFSATSIGLYYPLYEGDRIYLEDGYLWEYRENEHVVFDGSVDEMWVHNSNSTFEHLTINVNNLKKTKVFSNLFKFGAYDNRPSIYADDKLNIFIDVNTILQGTSSEKLAKWKEIIKANPLEVVYRLATPTKRKLAQASAYNLRTFDGKTYIDIVGAEEVGAESTFVVPRNTSGGYVTDAFAQAKINEIMLAEQSTVMQRLSALEQLALKGV